ncbi:hypothetical protein PENANT_c006G10970, partial [Penicillium antarcticum]
MKRLRWTT